MSLEIHQIVDVNPNDRIGGGGCLCSPGQKVSACKGPYVLFPNAEVAGDPDAGIHNSPHAVASCACIIAAAKASGGEVLSTAPVEGRGDTPDLDFHDLPEDEQQALVDQFPKGGLTKLLSGKRVNVPPSSDIEVTVYEPGHVLAARAIAEFNEESAPNAALEDLLGDTEAPKLEEPGTAPNTTVPATPEFTDEPKDAPLDESGPELEL